MARRQSTEEWLIEATTDTEKGGDCFALALVHYTGQQPTEVDRVLIPCSTMSLREIASRFDARIKERIRDMSGVQQCALLAFYGTSSEPGAQRPFTLTGVLEHPGLVTEPPTGTGVLTQVMRQNELLLSSMVTGMRGMTEGYQQLAKSALEREAMATEEISRLRNELSDAWNIVRNIGVQAQSENLDREIKLKKEERTNTLIERVMKWAPALINTITQKQVFPQTSHDTALVEGLLSEMQPEHIQMLSAFVPPHVMGLVSTRAQQIFADRKAKELEMADAKRLEAGTSAEGELQ